MHKRSKRDAKRTTSSEFAKVTISLPRKDLELIEQLSEKLNMSRSGVMLYAVRRWFDEIKKQGQISDYLKGYRVQPENEVVLKVMESIQSQSLNEEDW